MTRANGRPRISPRPIPRLPTLVIAGDSTAAPGDPAHRGWGAVLVDFFDTSKLNIINCAVGGRSFRTFYGEGKWKQIVDALKPGDFVIIEFGHNDGGNPNSPPYRGDVPGIGDNTVDVTKPGSSTPETVHSFGWYLRTFIHDVKSKNATPIVSSPTVRDQYHDGKIERAMGHYNEWEKQIAAEEKVAFFDHTNSTADLLEKMGPEEAAKFYPGLPRDGTHTSTEAHLINAKTIVANIKATPSLPLASFLNDQANDIPPYTPATTQP